MQTEKSNLNSNTSKTIKKKKEVESFIGIWSKLLKGLTQDSALCASMRNWTPVYFIKKLNLLY